MSHRQFDLRTPHVCSNGPSNILINLLSHVGKLAEVRVVDICYLSFILETSYFIYLTGEIYCNQSDSNGTTSCWR